MSRSGHRGPEVVLSTTQVLEQGQPVLAIYHFGDDEGTWVFLSTETDPEEDYRVVTMEHMLRLDPGLEKMKRLPVGWTALRDHVRAPWYKTPQDDLPLVSVPGQGFSVVLAPSARNHDHRFCGDHRIEGAVCPNCDKPMLRVMSLDTADARLELQDLGVPAVHLLFCWTCNLAQGESAYELREDGGIRWVSYLRGGVERDFPYPDYPPAFPGTGLELEALSREDQATLIRLNEGSLDPSKLDVSRAPLCQPAHQIGGEPFFVQSPPAELCPVCWEPMLFLASVADATLDGRGFTGNSGVQQLYMLCRKDRIVTTLQQCD